MVVALARSLAQPTNRLTRLHLVSLGLLVGPAVYLTIEVLT
jgi:hypothetical protein